MDMNEAIAAALRAERGISGVTFRDLSTMSGVPSSTLTRVLQAERDIKVNQLAALATAFNVKPSEIVLRAEELMARESRHEGTSASS